MQVAEQQGRYPASILNAGDHPNPLPGSREDAKSLFSTTLIIIPAEHLGGI